MEHGKPAPWEHRSLHIDSLGNPLNSYAIDHLPEGWNIVASESSPLLGSLAERYEY
ncbi:Outer membrane channel protein CpnT [Mycobacterium shimoidei]|uniref:Outer membrane channel protein CpnT n=1 Tax=Mycobacterium shimoidei TaxID=29313 RepID=A0A375Z5J8_MYCSH|nr:Outer membrane channel protein CpnT [Mycobacterium shimoidei]